MGGKHWRWSAGGVALLAACGGTDGGAAAVSPDTGRARPERVERSEDPASLRVAVDRGASEVAIDSGSASVECPPDLERFLALLEESGERVPPLCVSELDLERLFREPEDDSGTGPYARRTWLDFVGDSQREAVVAISDGWWGSWLRVCVFERSAQHWTLANTLRIDDTCRGLPAIGVVSAAGRRWLRLSWTDGWGTGVGSGARALLELVGERLVKVLHTTDGGWIAGWGNPIDIEYGAGELALRAEGTATVASLAHSIDATASELIDSALDAKIEARFVFRQHAPGRAFELVEPAQRGAPTMQLVMELAEEGWLAQHEHEACRLASEGTREQKYRLRLLADGILGRKDDVPARTLSALLPPAEDLAPRASED